MGEAYGVVVGKGISKGLFSPIKEVLSVEEYVGALGLRLRRHGLIRGWLPDMKKQNPAGGPEADPTGSK